AAPDRVLRVSEAAGLRALRRGDPLRCAGRPRPRRVGGERPHRSAVRIAVLTAIAAVIATAVNYAIQEIVRQAFAVPVDFEPYQGTVVPYTIGGIGLAGLTYALVRRFVR